MASMALLLDERCIDVNELGRRLLVSRRDLSADDSRVSADDPRVSADDPRVSAEDPRASADELLALGGELLFGDGSPELIPESRLVLAAKNMGEL